MSPVATQRPATRDERPYSLFSFSPERVLGLKRAAEVRRRPSPGIPPASVSETIPPPPRSLMHPPPPPAPPRSPSARPTMAENSASRRRPEPRARRYARVAIASADGFARDAALALASTRPVSRLTPGIAILPSHPRPLLPSVPPPGKKTTRRFVPRDALASRAPFPARPRWIRDVARLSSRRRAPRSRADPRPRANPAPRFPIRDRRRRGIR